MGLLLYKSDEMYSSTELIRKSKMIFEKVTEHKIEKAVILQDGKPCFLLMDFQKYEQIISEYEALKTYVAKLKDTTKTNTKPIENNDNQINSNTNSLTINNEISPQTPPIAPLKVQNKENAYKEDKEILSEDKETLSEEEEINNALKSIANMNFDDDMKMEAELKIKARILQARAERLKVLADEKQQEEDMKEERLLQNKLKETKMKKDRELQEFWD